MIMLITRVLPNKLINNLHTCNYIVTVITLVTVKTTVELLLNYCSVEMELLSNYCTVWWLFIDIHSMYSIVAILP